MGVQTFALYHIYLREFGFFFFQLKKRLHFTGDEADDVEDEGTQRAVLGSMVFPAECYDDDNAWVPLMPRRTQNTHTPCKVSATHTHYTQG